jgi:hypothetical protein
MQTVDEIARQYETSTAFVVRALEQLGCRAAQPHTQIPASTLTRFEKAFGDRLRGAHGAPPPDERAPDDPLPLRQRPVRVIRVAHATNAGSAHAIDTTGTDDGDPWRHRPADGAHHVYADVAPFAACGVQVTVLLGEMFDGGREDACPQCAEVVSAGEAYRDPPGFRYHCEAHLRAVVDGRPVSEPCRFRDRHDGPHETGGGATWTDGLEDEATPAGNA